MATKVERWSKIEEVDHRQLACNLSE